MSTNTNSEAIKPVVDKEQFLAHADYLRSRFPAGSYLEMRGFYDSAEMQERYPKDPGKAKFFRADYFYQDQAYQTAQEWQLEGRGVFFGIQPRAAQSGTKESVHSLVLLPLDADVEGDQAKKDAVIARAKDLNDLAGALVLDSGNGVHVYRSIVPIEATVDYSSTVESLAEQDKDWDPAVKDYARVMRAGGTWNLKCKNGNGPLPVKIVHRSDVPAVPLADLPYFRKAEVKPGTQSPSPKAGASSSDWVLKAEGSDKLPAVDWLFSDDVIGEGETLTQYGFTGRNNAIFKSQSGCVGEGMPKERANWHAHDSNERLCVPPLPWEVVDDIHERVYSQYEPNKTDAAEVSATQGKGGALRLTSPSLLMGQFAAKEMPALDYVIHGLARRDTGMISAHQSSYKTTLAFGMGLSLAAGRVYEPFTRNAGTFVMYSQNTAYARPRNVVYLDFENSEEFAQRDLNKIVRANFSDPEHLENITKRFLPLVGLTVQRGDDPDTLDELRLSDIECVDLVCGEIERHFGDDGADLVIVDTMAEAFDLEDENSNGAKGAGLVSRVVNRMKRKTGAAILLLHHYGKVGEEANQRKDMRSRGASRLSHKARYIAGIEQQKDSGNRFLPGLITFTNWKAKGPLMTESSGISLQHDPDRRWLDWVQGNTSDDAAEAKPPTGVGALEGVSQADLARALVDIGAAGSQSTAKRTAKKLLESLENEAKT